MLYKSAVEKNDRVAVLMYREPGAAGIAIAGKQDGACAVGVPCRGVRRRTPMLFIAVRGEQDMFFGRNECYCAHCCLYLMVDEATPNSSGISISETSVIPTRIKAM